MMPSWRHTGHVLVRGGLTGRAQRFTNGGMSAEPTDSLIPYDEIVQEALRAVVGRVLRPLEHTGVLPGDHHFYITFMTTAPGVEIPAHLRARFPDEMTVVLQHKFWDLKVGDDCFEVGLSFGGVPARLFVPFAAITAFVDPAVDFSLHFQVASTDDTPPEHDSAGNDEPDPTPKLAVVPEEGSNVVAVDFKRKK